ncbi:MAG: RHS repeat-associated core domain-containing protein, partial [Oscillospiraceae bacterium]|nr:RHS repeat-associated core domain-containing protein [Oscillospiraceae bacterium]
AIYTYNPDNMRQSKTVNGDTVQHIWLGSEIALDISAYDVVSYVGGIKSSYGWHLFNAHGDVVQLADDYGDVIRIYDYDPFGNQLQDEDLTDFNPYRYNRQYYDFESGYIYLRARYYSPEIGRFISEDPAFDGHNWYIYAANNPVMFVDPGGMFIQATANWVNRQVKNWQQGVEILKDSDNAFVRGVGYYSGCVGAGIGATANFSHGVIDGVSESVTFGVSNNIAIRNNNAAHSVGRVVGNASSLLAGLLGTVSFGGTTVGLTASGVGAIAAPATAAATAGSAAVAVSSGKHLVDNISMMFKRNSGSSDYNWNKIDKNQLKKELSERYGTDPHTVKKEFLGNKANVDRYDLKVDKNSGRLGVFEKSTSRLVDITDYFVK